MLARYILPLSLSCRPSLFGHCLLTSFIILIQFARAEVQKSCMQTAVNKVSKSCWLACQCRPYPPLPPPPPPPLLPRLMLHHDPLIPSVESWWKETIVLGTVGCVSVVFLFLTAALGYKAIKRKPLRKEENGTRECAMSSCSMKKVNTNNTGV